MRTLQCFEKKKKKKFKKKFKQKKNYESFFMQFCNADATMILIFQFCCPQKVEKTTLKSCSEKLKSTFFLTASSAQTAQTENFMFQNVAYRPTVYRTGSKLILRFRLILHPYAVNSFCSFFSFIKQKIADSLDLNHYFSSYL